MATRFLTLCLATAVAAAPAFVPRTLNGTAFDVERGLLADEILLFGKDHLEVVHKDAFAAMLATEGVLHQPPGVDRSLLDFVAPSEEDQELKRLEARQFYDWDLQMSPVIVTGANPATIAHSSTYTVTDTIAVNGAFSPTIVTGSRSWSTATAITVTGTISARHTGIMVTNPFKTRRYGRVMRGCLGRQTQVGTFMSDAYREGSFGGVRWITGVLSHCEKPGVHRPLTRCMGSGSFN
ncbi:hypothetical protein CTA2_10451 [Colletotrichum tanaceti]|nr:hypothetical protein CTA2_10451 [Colletotrichum tanaceti]